MKDRIKKQSSKRGGTLNRDHETHNLLAVASSLVACTATVLLARGAPIKLRSSIAPRTAQQRSEAQDTMVDLTITHTARFTAANNAENMPYNKANELQQSLRKLMTRARRRPPFFILSVIGYPLLPPHCQNSFGNTARGTFADE